MSQSLEDIQRQYQMQAAVVGDMVYRKRIIELELGRAIKAMKELNKAAARLSRKETANAESEASVPTDAN
jgi:hypothetical protein